MVGGQDFDKAPFNLATNGLRQPGSSFKPFTLRHRAEGGHLPGRRSTSPRPQEIPFEATIINKNGETKKVTDIFRVNNYDDNYLGSASIATATTYSDNSVYAQLGTDVGINDIVDTAHELGISSKLDDNPALILGGLETRRHAARDGLRLQHRSPTTGPRSAARSAAAATARARSRSRRSRPRTTTTRSSSPTTPAPRGENEKIDEAGRSTRRSPTTATRHPPHRRHQRHRQERPGRRRLHLGQDRHDRQQRRRLVRRRQRGHHRRRLGRLPRRRDADADRVRRPARSTAARSRR